MLTLFHRELGGAGKPPLVVLHGLLGSSRNWQSVGADLAGRYEIVALDLRNHGRSPHAEEMSYAAMVDDVIAWMDARGWGRVTLMGHSMGGKVAMRLACAFPERVERLVVVDIAPKDYLSAAHWAEFAAMNELELRSLQSRGEAELKLEGRVADWAMRKFLTTNLERDETSGDWKWSVNLPVLTRALPELEKTSLAAGDGFGGAVRFIRGGKSRYVREEDWAEITRRFPRADVVTIEGAGHNPHMEARVEFVRAVVGGGEVAISG